MGLVCALALLADVTTATAAGGAAVNPYPGYVYLSLIVKGNPSDPRIDNIGGDLTPEWGMHLIDVNVAMGDLVSLARRPGQSVPPALRRGYRRRVTGRRSTACSHERSAR